MGKSEFSQELKALCAEGSQIRKPPPPWQCKKSGCHGGVDDMIARLCYKEGMAGMWVYVCGACSTVHHNHNQRPPEAELLERIEAQRKCDNKKHAQSKARKAASTQRKAEAKRKAADERKRKAEEKKRKHEEKKRNLEEAVRQAEDAERTQQQEFQDEERARQLQEEEDERELQRKEEEKMKEDRRDRERKMRAKRRDRAQRAVNQAKKAAQKTHEARERLRSFTEGKKTRVREQACASRAEISHDSHARKRNTSDELEDNGMPSTSVFADRRNWSEGSPSVERADKEDGAHSKIFQLVFWSKKWEQPLMVKMTTRGEGKVVLADQECIRSNETPNDSFQQWAEVTSYWVAVPNKQTVIHFDADTTTLLVRKDTVEPCVGLAQHISKLQMTRMVAEMGADAAEDFVRDMRAAIADRKRTPGTVWVVVWYNENNFPEAYPLQSTGKKLRFTNLTKHPRLRAGDAIEFWNTHSTDWTPWDLSAMSTCIHGGDTVLVRKSDARSLPLLGLELEALAMSIEEESDADGGAGGSSRDVNRVRSPSVEVMDGPPPGYKRRARDARA
ncbi:hypothetical protein ONZ51_g11088 [Trametes cubensis]|uniref:Uncharacterized protein n=1 Tax=Trametes cubensis TaxID=1111947 RepID=A0AAD7TI97_9APHY|nr:hypothetical protein ONZ51_g11088 [Trametes cubensis]